MLAEGESTRIDPAEVERIARAVGRVPRVAYEGAHVYPLSAPNFASAPRRARHRIAAGPLKIYVHVPFCRYACTFCFYAKRVNVARAEMERYVAALRRELDWVEPGTPLRQLYVGGGTPTALPAELLDEVLGLVLDRMPAEAGASMTVEASPETVTPEHVRVLRRRGIDRVSMGVETLDEGILDTIHRRHSPAQALDACSLLVESGLFVNVDLIYALPGQSESGFAADLAAVAARRPQSLTLYNLRLNEHTPLARVVGDLDRLDVAGLLRWRAFVLRATAEHGYLQTRWHTFLRREDATTSFHRPPCVEGAAAGRQLGVGVSAVSHLDHTLYRNHERFEEYLARVESGESPVEGAFELGGADLRTLFLVHTLGDGFALDTAEYENAFGTSFRDDFGPALERCLAAGLLRDDAGSLTLGASGRLLYDLVTLAFYPDHAREWLRQRQDAPQRPSALAASAAAGAGAPASAPRAGQRPIVASSL